MKKFGVLVVFLLLLVLLAVRLLSLSKEKERPIGGERDEHCCLGPAGYTWCETKQKCLREWEEPCEQEEIFNLLTELEKASQIDFSGITKVELNWQVEGEKVGKTTQTKTLSLQGKGFDAVKVPSEKTNKIKDFFENQGFGIDLYNVFAATIAGATGYQKDQIICLVTEGATGYQQATGQWIPPEPEKQDIGVKCAHLEPVVEDHK